MRLSHTGYRIATAIATVAGIASVLYLDRITKLWALTHATMPQLYTSWCILIVGINRSVAWSDGSSSSAWATLGVFCLALGGTIIASYGLIYALHYNRRYLLPMGFIVAGAIGNLYDRYTIGGVIDFILLHYNGISWPLFNIADVAICIGGMLIARTILLERNPTQ